MFFGNDYLFRKLNKLNKEVKLNNEAAECVTEILK